jgi:hypothetical protein
MQSAAPDRRKIIVGQPTFSLLSYLIEFTLKTGYKVVGLLGQVEFGIGQVTLYRPACGAV